MTQRHRAQAAAWDLETSILSLRPALPRRRPWYFSRSAVARESARQSAKGLEVLAFMSRVIRRTREEWLKERVAWWREHRGSFTASSSGVLIVDTR